MLFPYFLVYTVLGLITTQLSFSKIKVPASLLFLNKWIVIKGEYFQITYTPKTWQQQVVNCIRVLHYTLIVYYWGNVVERDFSLWYCFLGLVVIPVFGTIQEIRGLEHFSLDPNSLKHLTPIGKVYLGILATMLPSILGYHFWLAKENSILEEYTLGIFGLIGMYIILYWLLRRETGDSSWHIHHWFIGYFYCLVCRFDCTSSKVLFCVFYSVFMQGSQVYYLDLSIGMSERSEDIPILKNAKLESERSEDSG